LIVKLVNPLKPTNMATACPNCKARLSCGCQTRKASNGAAVCTNCLGKYEASLKIAKNTKPPQTNK
jgi:hypothetical protein